jgi:hypothetical protein
MRLFINLDDSIGVEVKDIKSLYLEVAQFTEDVFGLDSENISKLFHEGRFLDYADAISHKNQYKEPLSTSVHTYAKAMTRLMGVKKLEDASNCLNDLNKLFINMKLPFNFRVVE